jgi:hypothetical protein
MAPKKGKRPDDKAAMPSPERVQYERAKIESMDDFFDRDGVLAWHFSETMDHVPSSPVHSRASAAPRSWPVDLWTASLRSPAHRDHRLTATLLG